MFLSIPAPGAVVAQPGLSQSWRTKASEVRPMEKILVSSMVYFVTSAASYL
jgi:hypothetical protein